MPQITENKMGTAPVLPLIVSMSLPAIFSMLVQALYNIVDSYFVAQVSHDALTAVSLAFPVQTLMIAVAVGTGIGLNSLVSRRLGEKKQEEADKAATHGIFLGVISFLVFALLGLFFTPAFFQAFNPNDAVFAMGKGYTYIVTLFSIGVFVEINLEKTLQATGNMIFPMLFQLSGAIINIILDPIFIFGLGMGVRGAAIATVIGQIASMFFALYVVLRKSHVVHISLKGFRPDKKTIRDIYAVGFPSIIMQSIMAFLTVCLNMILSTFGNAAINVLGVYYKLQSFIFMPVFGLTHGILPIMGYNFGAKNRDRLIASLKYGSIIALAIMTIGTLLFWTLPKEFLGMFNADAEMLRIGIPALKTISLCFPFAALGILFSTLFQGCGMGNRSLIVSMLRQLVGILPAAWFLARFGVNMVWYAFPFSEGISFIASILLFIGVYRKCIKDMPHGIPVHGTGEAYGN